MSKSRYIGGNKGSEGPSNLIFFDTESRQTKTKGPLPITSHSLRLWTAIHARLEGGRSVSRTVARGKTPAEFWQFVDKHSQPTRRTWLFAHNIGFDLTMLRFWDEMDKGTFTLKPLPRRSADGQYSGENSWSGKLVIDHGITFIVVRNGRKTYTMVDTCNYWPRKLWKIGDEYNLPKLDMPDPKASDDDWFVYCLRDTEIVEVAVTTLITSWVSAKCGVFKPTAASLSFTNWLHTCDVRTPDGKSVDMVVKQGAEWHELERAAYFGGRVQPFYFGQLQGPIYHVDVNSLYPYVMREHQFPRRFVDYGRFTTIADLRRKTACYGAVANVLLRTRIDTYPVRVQGRQLHLCGSYWATLCGPELQRALRDNHIVRVGSVQYYSLAPLFRGWVDYWFRRKLEAGRVGGGGAGEREFCKCILNSLSGKFAQHGRYWVDVPGKVALERWGGWGGGPPPQSILEQFGEPGTVQDETDNKRTGKQRFNYRGIAGHVQVLLDDMEPRHAFPLVSAYISSYAREFMYAILCSLPPRSAFYMATDSLLLSKRGYRALCRRGLVDDERLGAFRLVSVYSSLEIKGSNNYVADGKLVCAGLEGKASNGMGKSKVCEVWERLPSVIATKPDGTINVRTVPLAITQPDRKGTVDAEGWWHPYRVSDDPEFTDKPGMRHYTREELDRMSATDWK